MAGELDGDVAIVTGAGRNIGRAIAERFAREGARVAIADINEGRARATAESIRDEGHEATAVTVDTTDEAQVQDMVAAVEEAYGPPTVLVNNAAVMDRAGLLDLDVAEWDRVQGVNLRGTFLCTREVARAMVDSGVDAGGGGGGRIVNVASTSAHSGRTDAVAYATSKAAILNFTRSAAKALAAHDVRVNTLTPTSSGSRTLRAETETADAAEDPLPPERAARIRADIPAGRIGTPEDQAAGALFLVSPESSFVTGTELRIDGGRTA